MDIILFIIAAALYWERMTEMKHTKHTLVYTLPCTIAIFVWFGILLYIHLLK
jgi:hypothetical protein